MSALEISPRLNVSQAKFLQMPHKFRAFVAGFGCLRGSTLIATEFGLMPIQDITKPMRVLSWNEKKHQFELALTGGAFPKGAGYLYRVCTQQGEFVASEHHRVFCADGSYQRVDALCVGDKVRSFSANLHQTNLELAPKSLHVSGQRSMQMLEGSMGRYADAARLYGQRLHQVEGSDLTSTLRQGDAHTFDRSHERKGGYQEPSLKHNHQGQSSDLLCKMGLAHHDEHHEASGQYYSHVEHSVRALHCSLGALLFQTMLVALFALSRLSDWLKYFLCAVVFYVALIQYRIAQCIGKPKCDYSQSFCKAERLSNQGARSHKLNALKDSCVYSTIKTSDIISITRLEEKEVYFDLQVLDNNNYVSADGAVHHNSGKTWVGCSSLCTHVWNSPKVPSSYFAPTYPQIRDIFYPTIEECAFDYGLRVEIMESNKEVHYYRGRQYRGTTICRSMEKPSAIVGFKTGKSLVDELDLLSTDKARQAWNKIIARHRAKGNDADFDDDAVTQASQIEIVRNTNGIDVTTTPEGFKFTYEQFVKNINKTQKRSEFYGLIQASTFDNELNLPPDYIDSLLESYDPNLINAYLNGQFVNLASGAVYPEFDRILNHTDELILPNEPLHIGMDFNVLKMAAAVNVIRNGEPRALAELTGIRDTPAMVEVIKEKYPDHKIMIYPDASGQNTSSKSSTESDHSILRQAGFSVYVDGSNPRIKDRVNAFNAMILNSKGERRFKVNTNTCPDLTEGLEQQIYDKQGMPDKTAGVDHLNDAAGYFINKRYPITKPVTKLNITFG